jgi:uncharacterized membrane protein
MKRTFGVVIGLGIIIGLGVLLFGGSTIEVNNETQDTATSTSEVMEPTADEKLEAAIQQMIAEAITASSTDIQAAKDEAANAVEEEMHRTIERRVRDGIKDSNDERIIEIDKETGAY